MTTSVKTLIALAFLLCGATVAQAAPFKRASNGQEFARLAEAVAAIGNGSDTILIAPGVYRQCAVQENGQITYKAEKPTSVVFDGIVCEGKAALVLRGRSAKVEGITFQNIYVPDGNGAGIRLEQGDLSVEHSTFRNSEQGILTHNDPRGTIQISHSTFSRLGRCDRGLDCAHSIYVGRYGALTVADSRFESGTGGHYIKSRAARANIERNSFDDSKGRHTNYMIDLSNGAAGLIADNIMVQGRMKDNYSAFITIAPEGREHDSSSLIIRDNQAGFVPGLTRTSSFVANWSDDLPKLSDNALARGIEVTDKR